MKKQFLSLLVLPFLLLSCGKKGPEGKYTFQMGKDKGTHFGISMTLSNDDYKADPSKGKDFTFSLEAVFPNESSTSDEPTSVMEESTSVSESSESESSTTDIDILGLTQLEIGGYYNLGEQVDGVYDLNLGVSRIASIDIGEYADIPPTIVEYFMISKLYSNRVEITVPVSAKDLTMQLFWFGFDWSYGGEVEELDKHPVGSHPNKDDVKAINDKGDFKKRHGYEFRDFNTITMGLAKQ